jgi:PAS domain S-box-containing protein
LTAFAEVSAGLYEAIVASSDDAILSKDRDAIITTWNPAAERLYGYSADEAIGKPIAIIIPPDRAGEERRILDRILAGGRVEHYETERLTKNGRIVNVSLTISPVREPGGEIVGASVIARDVTERRLARERAERLQEVTVKLGRQVSPGRTVEVLLANALPALGADAGAVALVDAEAGELELAGSAGYRAIAEFERMPLDAELPIAEVVRTGEPLWVGSGAELRSRFPALGDAPLEYASLAIVPLAVGGPPFGAVALSFTEAHDFRRGERAFMLATVQQAAYAFERTWLFEAERRRREQLDFLVEASEVLSSSLDVDETLERLAFLAVPTIADWCSIDLAADDEGIRNVAVAHADPDRLAIADRFRERYPPDPQDPRGAPNVIRTGKSELYATITDELLVASAVDEEHLRMIRDLGMTSLMVVPLAARGRTLGAMTLVAAESGRHYSDADLGLAEELARHAALAVDNAALYHREHDAAVTLQRALLPAQLPSMAEVEIAASYLPAGPGLEVGGDWYDVVETAAGLAVVVGDVAGRGLPAATIMGRLRTGLRAYVLEGYPPVAAIERLNGLMDDFAEASMATVVHLALDPARGRAEYVRAGHPPPLVRDPSGAVRQLEDRGSPPLGVFHDVRFRSDELTLEPGSTILLYTDGLIERPGEGITVGLERLKAAFAACRGGAEETVEGVIDRLGAPTLADDVAVVALRFRGPGAGSPTPGESR